MMYRWVFGLVIYLLFVPAAASLAQTDSLLRELSQAIRNKDTYIQQKQERIERLHTLLAQRELSAVQHFDIYNRIYNEYRTFQYDSAFTYALRLQETAQELNDPVKITYSKLKLSLTLLSSGMYKEALDSLATVQPAQMPDSLKVDYYGLMARANFDLSTYTQDRFYTTRYLRAGETYVDSALALLEQHTLPFYALRGMMRKTDGARERAKADFQTILKTFDLSLHEYAMAANSLGTIYYEQGDTDKGIELMARAAIADVKASVKEGVALMTLAEYLYQQGEEEQAYFFIRQALEDADFYGARQRKIQVAAILPVIEGERLATVEEQRSMLYVYAIAVTLLSLLVLVFAVIIFRQLRQLRQTKRTVTEAYDKLQEVNNKLQETITQLQETNEKLQEANIIKEEYIGYSFNQYAGYIDKMEKLKKAVEKKLATRKPDEVSAVLDSFNLSKEREAIYHSFDKVFIKLFPNFIPAFNSFFREEDRIIPKDNTSFTIELRIFALIRIGIQEHEQIAKILEYSVRTIYNYKTKVKSRSLLSNEEFEKRIMEIKAF